MFWCDTAIVMNSLFGSKFFENVLVFQIVISLTIIAILCFAGKVDVLVFQIVISLTIIAILCFAGKVDVWTY